MTEKVKPGNHYRITNIKCDTDFLHHLAELGICVGEIIYVKNNDVISHCGTNWAISDKVKIEGTLI